MDPIGIRTSPRFRYTKNLRFLPMAVFGHAGQLVGALQVSRKTWSRAVTFFLMPKKPGTYKWRASPGSVVAFKRFKCMLTLVIGGPCESPLKKGEITAHHGNHGKISPSPGVSPIFSLRPLFFLKGPITLFTPMGLGGPQFVGNRIGLFFGRKQDVCFRKIAEGF